MKIANQTVVSFHYTVKDKEGDEIDSSVGYEPLVALIGHKNIIEGLEESLIDKVAGDKFATEIEANKAYGPRHDELMQTLPKEMFASLGEVEVGMQLRASTDQGEQSVIVVDVTDEEVTVDGNHPLAGIDLEFDIEILTVRAATAEELAHGHVHNDGESCESGTH